MMLHLQRAAVKTIKYATSISETLKVNIVSANLQEKRFELLNIKCVSACLLFLCLFLYFKQIYNFDRKNLVFFSLIMAMTTKTTSKTKHFTMKVSVYKCLHKIFQYCMKEEDKF